MSLRIFTALATTAVLGMRMMLAQQPGTLDPSFDPGGGTSTGAYHAVSASVIQPDGKILIGGFFNEYDGVPRGRIARIHSNGALDTTFNSGAGVGGVGWPALPGVHAIALQPDGKVLIGGYFTTYDGINRAQIARLLQNGDLDTTFTPGAGANDHVWSVVVQPDGKILIGGEFTMYDGIARSGIARLDPDGSLDPGFDPGTGINGGSVQSIALQPDGKIIIAGIFTQFNGTGVGRITRLNADGSRDEDFLPNGVGAFIWATSLQPDGRIIIAGGFSYSINDIQRRYIARLHADGSLDASFAPASGASDLVFATALQADGRIIIGGYFTSYDGVERNFVARIEPNGALDHGFDPGDGVCCVSVNSITLQPDGRALIGGEFSHYDGTARGSIARIMGGGALPAVSLAARAFLEGPYKAETGRMSDGLRASGLLPGTEPYTALGHALSESGHAVASGVLEVTGDDAIVDWVVVELRKAGQPGEVLASRSALIQRDGDIVDMDGASPVALSAPPGDYHVAVRHRNHLGVMTASPLTFGGAPVAIDLTVAATAMHGTNARKEISGAYPTWVLWAGDVNFDGTLRYTGEDNDRDPILVAIGGTVPTATASGYLQEDVNMDGQARYTGEDNDRDPILVNIGGTVPTNTRVEQIP